MRNSREKAQQARDATPKDEPGKLQKAAGTALAGILPEEHVTALNRLLGSVGRSFKRLTGSDTRSAEQHFSKVILDFSRAEQGRTSTYALPLDQKDLPGLEERLQAFLDDAGIDASKYGGVDKIAKDVREGTVNATRDFEKHFITLQEQGAKTAEGIKKSYTQVKTFLGSVGKELAGVLPDGQFGRFAQRAEGVVRALKPIASAGREVRRAFDGIRGGLKSLEKDLPILKNFKGLIKDIAFSGLAFLGVFTAGDAIIQFGRAAFETSSRINALETSLAFAAGSSRAAAEQIAFVRAESERLKVPLDQSIQGYQQLANAAKGSAYEGEAIQRVYTGLTQAARVNALSNEKLQQVYIGAAQVFSKGSVQAEELRGQILETGIGSFKQFADAMGVTTGELNRRLNQGRVTVGDFIKFTDKLAADSAAGVAKAVETPQAALAGFQAQFTKFQEQFGKALSPAAVTALNALGTVLQGIGGFAESVAKDFEFLWTALDKAGVIGVTSKLLGGLGTVFKALFVDTGALSGIIKALVIGFTALAAPALVAGVVGLFVKVTGAIGIFTSAVLGGGAVVTAALPWMAALAAAFILLPPLIDKASQAFVNFKAGMSEARRQALEAGETFDVKLNDAISKLQKGIPIAAEELQKLKDGFTANVKAGLDSAHSAEVLTGRLDKLQNEALNAQAAIDKLNKEVIESSLAFKKQSTTIEQAMLDQQASIAEARAAGRISGDEARRQELEAEAQQSRDLAKTYSDRRDTLASQLAEATRLRQTAEGRGQDTEKLVDQETQLQEQLTEINKQAAQSRRQIVEVQTRLSLDAVTTAESRRNAITQQLLNEQVITEEDANLRRAEGTRARVLEQIAVEGYSAQKYEELLQAERQEQQASNSVKLKQIEDALTQEQARIEQALQKRQITQEQATYLSLNLEGQKLDAQLSLEHQSEAELNKLRLERLKNEQQQREALKTEYLKAVEGRTLQEQITVQRALNQHQITQEQAGKALLDIERGSLHERLELEKDNVQERARLTLELLKNEEQQQEKLREITLKRLDQETLATENSVQRRKAALETINASIEEQSKLIEAQKTLYEAINGIRSNAYDIAIKLAKSDDERGSLEQEAASYRLAALREAQRLEREIFELKLLQEQAQRNIAKAQNEADVAKAVAERKKLDLDPNATKEQKQAADLTLDALLKQSEALELIDGQAQKIASLQRQGLLSQQFVADRDARLNLAEKTVDPGQKQQLLSGLRNEVLNERRTAIATKGVEESSALARPTLNSPGNVIPGEIQRFVQTAQPTTVDPLQQRRRDIGNQIANPTTAQQLTPVDSAKPIPSSTLNNPGNVIQLTPGALQSLIQNAPRISLANQPPQAPQRPATQQDPAAVVKEFVNRLQVQQRPIMIELTQNFSPNERGQVADKTRTEVLGVLDEVTRGW